MEGGPDARKQIYQLFLNAKAQVRSTSGPQVVICSPFCFPSKGMAGISQSERSQGTVRPRDLGGRWRDSELSEPDSVRKVTIKQPILSLDQGAPARELAPSECSQNQLLCASPGLTSPISACDSTQTLNSSKVIPQAHKVTLRHTFSGKPFSSYSGYLPLLRS